MNLLLLETHELRDAGRVRLDGARAAHLLSVLRVTPGQSVRIGVVDGPRGIGTVESVDGDGAVAMRCMFEEPTPARPAVDLLLAVPRPKVLRRLWAQLAALGVGRIILTNAEKVESPYFATHFLRPEIYRPLLIEGLQQARDTRLPEVTIHRRFKPMVEDELTSLSDAELRLVADPSASRSVTAAVRADATSRILLAVGPEGGWNDFELTLLEAHGFKRVGMGPRILRTDTACLALLALVHDALSHPST